MSRVQLALNVSDIDALLWQELEPTPESGPLGS